VRAALLAALAWALNAGLCATGETIPNEERGRMEFRLEARERVDVRVARRGDVAWTEALVFPDVVRLGHEVMERARPGNARPIPSGEILVAYQLSTGTAYCPFFNLNPTHVRRIQCLRDFDGDGTFEGSYVGESARAGFEGIPWRVFAPVPLGRVPYERIAESDAPRFDAEFTFEGMRDGVAIFGLRTSGFGRTNLACVPEVEGDMCVVRGARVRVRIEGEGASIIALDARLPEHKVTLVPQSQSR